MRTVDLLHAYLGDKLEKGFFRTLVGCVIFINPLALVPQLYTVFTASSLEGISVAMWFIFAAIQAAMMFESIRIKSTPVFWSMFVSLCESAAIIGAVMAKR